jgi:hypothetical protein
MATAPVFSVIPRVGLGQVSTANTNRDGTGTIATILTGGSSGTKITEIVVEATGTTTAGMVRIYLNDGTNTRLFDEFLVIAVTAGASTVVYRGSRVYENLTLPNNSWSIRASTHNAETFNVFVLGADL